MKNYKEIPDEFILNKGPIDLTLSIEEHIIANEAARNLYAAMAELEDEERDIIENFYIKKINYIYINETPHHHYNDLEVNPCTMNL